MKKGHNHLMESFGRAYIIHIYML